MTSLTLTYFDAPGRAEAVRVAAALGGVAFEDERLSFADFGAHRAAGRFPLGSVPVLTVDGAVITQTGAMLRYIAKLGNAGLYPDDPAEALLVDSALDTFNDTLANALLPSLYERDMPKKLSLREVFAAGPLQQACAYVEGLLARGSGPFLLGDRLSIADIVIAHQVQQVRSGGLDGITPDALAAYTRLLALTDAYLALRAAR